MHINNKYYPENHKCEDCKHSDICKWCGDMTFKQDEVSKIPICKGLTPVKITISCDNFERKNLRQDGFALK